ncbi:hypothetical protein QAD02_009847 [Eretmocerus hayati]|uniref:Uncharacterized protein n=1 Tax=Eretmocerus hayati TaxID=131215 RepID=A0ACC2NAG0_9HYME|nr:hypothetical protein QAD02_009847 [Eretmocerus hayati]
MAEPEIVPEEEEKKGLVIFGRDITKIPCYRSSFLYGSSSYVGVGLITFLLTSKPGFSSHCGFGAFMLVTFGYYNWCIYKFAQQKFEYGQLQKVWQSAAILEGSELVDKKTFKAEFKDA